MPSTSKKQHGFMAAVANNPKFAKKVGVSKSVGEEFMKADKSRKFKEGGLKETDAESNPGLAKLPTEVRNKMGYMKKGGKVKHSDIKEDMKMDKTQDKSMMKKAFKQHDMQEHQGGKGTKLTLKNGGKVKKFAVGGFNALTFANPGTLTPSNGSNSGAYSGLDTVNKGSRQVGASLDTIGSALGDRNQVIPSIPPNPITPSLNPYGMKKGGKVKSTYKSGGSVSSASKRGDGIAIKGKTKGRMV